jgi:hypothetical protein
MALYDIVSGTTAVASDVGQLVNIFNGKHDIGVVNLAPQISAPTSGSFLLTAQAGSSLGVGAYNYQFTFVTGQYKSDGATIVKTGETLPSAALSITTTSGNTTVKITLPTVLPASVVAINIYRTSVGGSDYKLVATVKAGSANYTDNTADASRGTQTPPTSNTTGTVIAIENRQSLVLQNGWVGPAAPYTPPAYRKDPMGFVHLMGRISSGSTTQNVVIATLPTGYAPRFTMSFPVVTNNGSGDQTGQISIDSSGNIIGVLVYNSFTVLDSIIFPCAGADN